MALGQIAAGVIWLVSDKDSKFPSLASGKGKPRKDQFGYDDSDIHPRDYISHMSALEMRDGEDPAAYQRRRDTHRATFLMCERKPDEDEHGLRQRMADLTDKFRQKRRAWSDSISQAGSSGASSASRWRALPSRRRARLAGAPSRCTTAIPSSATSLPRRSGRRSDRASP